MSIERIIRFQARLKLKNNGFATALFGFAFIMVFFMLYQNTAFLTLTLSSIAITSVPGEIVTVVVSLICYAVILTLTFMALPVVFGYIRMFSTDKGSYNIADVFFFFSSPAIYFKSVLLAFNFFLRIIWMFILLLLPVGIFNICEKPFLKLMSKNMYTVINNSLVILTIIAIIVYSLRYFLVIRLFSENTSKKINSYFKESVYLMNGNKAKVLKLFFSFTPWILLCFTVLPILYVLPYVMQAMSLSGKYILELSRNGQ